MKWILCVLLFISSVVYAGEKILEIEIKGNARVEKEAISGQLVSTLNSELNEENTKKDILAIYELGYFSDVQIYKENISSGIKLIVEVLEKPAVTMIELLGMEELNKDDIQKALETKLHSILNEATLASDVRMIEKKYAEKGFYLIDVSYRVIEKDKTSVGIIFDVSEGGKVLVGDIHILGNHYFSTADIISKMVLQPHTRRANISSSSIFQIERLARDAEFLAYYYKDNGFSDVKVAKPVAIMDVDKSYTRVTFHVEEGIQYRVANISVSGDVGPEFYEESFLLSKMLLKSKDLFRYSRFSKDVEQLVDLYGDLGYAYVDVNPIPTFDKEKKTVDIDYQISKGKKVYFGQLTIIGNTKTRDNVIRREIEIADSELFSGTKLNETKNNVNRLGFFEEVQVIKERDSEIDDLMNLKVKVKEKSTGQLNATMGYTPSSETSAHAFGQGKYEEKNQSGRAWNTSVTLKYTSNKNYQFDLGFFDPRVKDSHWSFGTNYGYEVLQTKYYDEGFDVVEKRHNISVTVGRKVIELIRANFTLSQSRNSQENDLLYYEGYQVGGTKNNLTMALVRRDLNDYIDPSEGLQLVGRHGLTGGFLGGQYTFMESSADGIWYYPIDFSDDYRTYFKFGAYYAKLWSLGDTPVPAIERYKLGGYNDLRGFETYSIGPKEQRARTPFQRYYEFNRGGDRKFYMQNEYFMPLIKEAGIKFILFMDCGKVFNEDESFEFSGMDFDVGFGFRWLTPVAPFRFEWAMPYDKKREKFGDMNLIFNIGF